MVNFLDQAPCTGVFHLNPASLAKNAGFRWNSPVQGAWSRKLTSDEAKNLDFRVEILN